jgi:peroxiredoxin
LALTILSFAPVMTAQTVSDGEIVKQIGGLRQLPDATRGAQTAKVAVEIRALPASLRKVQLANGLAHLATEGDPGRDNLQEVTTTLGQSLSEFAVPPAKDNKPSSAYMELAQLVRYEGMTTTLSDPQLTAAQALLEAQDAEIQHANFTLKDINGKKVTLSELRGKIVMVNFWATWCPPCRREMPDLDAIYNHYKSQGLVILSITDEDMFKVGPFIAQSGYKYPILLDPGRKVADQFHVTGIPRSFVFDRDGKLVAQSLDMRTQHQFLLMLAKAGLKPQ